MSKRAGQFSGRVVGFGGLPSGFIAAVLALVIPGAGHIFLGRYRRGIIIFLVIGITFWAGIAIGGVMTVDFYYEKPWFIAQSLTGIHGGVAWYRQNKVYDKYRIDEGKEPRESLGDSVSGRQVQVDKYLADRELALACPGDNVARAYSGVAGMLNVMCVFDVFMLGMLGVRGEGSKPRKRRANERQEDKA